MSSSPSILSLEQVSFRYRADQDPVLDAVSVSVAAGDYVGILGPNGSGKSTLVKIVLGLLEPQRGEVKLFGRHREKLGREELSRIGYVSQRSSSQFFEFPVSVDEIVMSGRVAKMGWRRKLTPDDHEAVAHAMHDTNTESLRGRLMDELSGGQRQRVLIARALAADPELLVLDEPTTGVDQASQVQFYEILDRLNSKHGMTILFISHDAEVISKKAKHALCVNKGAVTFMSAGDVLREENMRALYGDSVTRVAHDHHLHE